MTEKIKLKITPEAMLADLTADYSDGDIIIVDDIRQLPAGDQLQIDMVLLLVCMSGRAQFEINGKTHTACREEMVVCPPNVLVDNYLISPDFRCVIIGLSYPALQRMLHANNEIWDMIVSVSASPVFRITDEMRMLMMRYYSLLKFKLSQPENAYKRESMRSLMQSIFYDLCDIVRRRTPQSEVLSEMKQGDVLVKKFLRLLANAQGEQRSVAYYARQLCVSAKYLSTVCKKSTGRTAKEWIQEYTVEILRHQLRNTDRSIKEIANIMGFPNLSVFGKFCRTTLGLSPTDYRAKFRE